MTRRGDKSGRIAETATIEESRQAGTNQPAVSRLVATRIPAPSESRPDDRQLTFAMFLEGIPSTGLAQLGLPAQLAEHDFGGGLVGTERHAAATAGRSRVGNVAIPGGEATRQRSPLRVKARRGACRPVP